MKKLKSCLALLLSLILICGSVPPIVSSAAQNKITLIKKTDGYLDEYESKSYNFYMPADGNIIISFFGWGDSGRTYGSFEMEITDSEGKSVYYDSDFISFDDTSYDAYLKKGSYTLTITEDDEYNFEYTFKVDAYIFEDIQPTSVSLNKKSAKLGVGDKLKLKASYSPSSTTFSPKWSTSNSKVATVTSKGVVKAKALGKSTINVKVGKKSAKCTVLVNKKSISINKGKTASLTKLTKNIKSLKNNSIKNSDKSVISISNGNIKALKNGKATITMKDKKGNTYTIKVKVNNPVTAKATEIYYSNSYGKCYVEFKNNTNKKINYIELNIIQYDNRHYKLKSPYSYYYVNEYLPAHSSDTWYFWVNEDTRSATVKIKKVYFTDGTTWKP